MQVLHDEFRSAQDRLHRLRSTIPAERWAVRPDAVARARSLGGPAPDRYRRDFLGWLLWRMLGPPVRFRLKTLVAFVPHAGASPDDLVREFDRLQAEQLGYLQNAERLQLGQVPVVSPFNADVRYNLFTCFSVLPRHQHRHFWQAEHVSKSLQG